MKNAPENFVVIHLSATEVRTVIACESACKTKTEIMAIGSAKCDSFYHGKIIHREKLVGAIKQSIRDAEEMANVRVMTAVICLASPELYSNNGLGEVYVLGETIDNDHMARALSNVKKRGIPEKYYLAHFIPQMIWLDDASYTIKNAIGMTGVTKMSISYHLMSMPVQSLNNLYALFKSCNVLVDDIIFDMVAGAEYALIDDEKKRGVLFVDIGAKSTSVALYRENILVFSACLPVGGDDVTMDIAVELSLPVTEAERLKHYYASLQLKEEDKQSFIDIAVNNYGGVVHRYRLSQITKARYDLIFDQIVGLLADQGLSKAFFEAGVVLAGEATQIRGMVPYLKKYWGVAVHMSNLNQRIVLNTKRLSDDQLVYLSGEIQRRTLQNALGAMMYSMNDEFRHQERIYDDSEEVSSGVFARVGRGFDGMIERLKRLI